ncbi:MAG: Crp/Fnr family transcriptional regulator [Magnetococcales bacterium]|nr:Crp/Fnr family transcriptional regulator [Magnetococcales bacterium]
MSLPERHMLGNVPLFAALTDEQLVAVVKGMRRIRLEEGENLFDDQTRADRFFLLRDGQIKLFRLSASGGEKVLEIIRPGDLFATAVMFSEEKQYPVSADALRPSEVFSFDNKTFMETLRHSPETCFRMMAEMSRRLRRQVVEIDSICLQSAVSRLINYLLEQAPSGVRSAVIQLDSPKNIIASRLSIQPETFSRVLRNLKRRGFVEVDNKTIEIADLEALRDFGENCSSCRMREEE